MKKLFFILLTLVSLQLLAQTTGKKIYIKVQGSGAGMINLKDRNYENDSIAVVDGGLHLWDYYRTAGSVKVVTQLPSSNQINWVINNEDGSANEYSFGIYAYSSGGAFDLRVDWGDGSVDSTTYTGGYDYTPEHTYSQGTYQVKIMPSVNANPRVLSLNNGSNDINIESVSNLNLLTDLVTIQIQHISSVADLISTTAIPDYVTEWNFSFNSNNLTHFDTTFPSGFKTLQLKYNSLTSFAPVAGLPATLNYLSLTNNNWNSTQVNALLAYMVTQTFNAGAKQLFIKQNTSSPPTGQGVTDMNTLIADGWTITHD